MRKKTKKTIAKKTPNKTKIGFIVNSNIAQTFTKVVNKINELETRSRSQVFESFVTEKAVELNV